MSKVNELEQKRSLLLTEATAALRSDKPSEERYQAYDAKVAEMQAVDQEIGRFRSAEKLEGEERQRQEAAEAALRSGRPSLPQPGAPIGTGTEEREESKEELEKRNKQHKRAHDHYLRTQDASQLRALNSTTGSNGGYTIPVVTQPVLVEAELSFGGVIPYLDQMPTSTGEQLNWPTNNDTTNMGVEIAENVAATDQDLAFASVPLNSGNFNTGLIRVPRTLLRDSLIDLGGIITKAMAIRRARLLALKVINGSNTGSFASLLSGAVLGATTASANAATLEDLASIFGAVDSGYALNGKFVMHRSYRIYLATLRNDLGAPIFPLDADQMLTKIFGCDIVEDQGMPACVNGKPVAGAKHVIFGDLKSYIFRPVGSLEIMRLEERYAEYNQVAFTGWYSAGGVLVDAGTHPIQVMAQHAGS